jgi:hypothetical protein
MRSNLKFFATMLVLSVLGLMGCESIGGDTKSAVSASGGVLSAEKAASARAEARWAAMIRKDLDGAYAFLSPGSKATNPLSLFKGKIRPLDWKSAKALSASCEAEKCAVKIELSLFDKRLGGDVATIFEETWLLDSGQWWLVFY